MDNVIDLVRIRRMRFEDKKSEKELSVIDFDEFGNPVPLGRKSGDEEENRKEAEGTDPLLRD